MYRPGRHRAPVSHVPLVTSAGPSRSEQVAKRRAGYLIVQGSRIAMFVIAIVAPLPIWLRGLLIVVACGMSLMSVTAANAPYPRGRMMATVRPSRPAIGGPDDGAATRDG